MKLIFSPLFSGSSGNATYIGNDKGGFLLDAGMPASVITDALKKIDVCPEDIKGIVITHEHSDHIKGAGILSRRYDIPIYASEKTWESMAEKIGKISNKNIIETDGDYYIGGICVSPIETSHDAADPHGYAFYLENKKFSVVTDTGKITKTIFSAIRKSDVVLLESNHDVNLLMGGRYPYELKMRIKSGRGHLSNEDCSKVALMLAESGTRGLLLGHLSKENNTENCAFVTTRTRLEENGIRVGKDIALKVARRDGITGLFSI